MGICQVDIYLPGINSLKQKRSILQMVKMRLRNKFNLSIAEVGHNHLWQRALLGIAVVSNERRQVQSSLDNIIKFLDTQRELKVIDYHYEI